MNKRRYALITGANGGIGEALCKTFVEAGYSVIATDIQLGSKENLVCTHYVSIDLNRLVEDSGYGKQQSDAVLKLVGEHKLHCLVNNAAVQILGGVDSLSRTDWQTTLNINLQAPFLLVQAFIEKLEAAKGSIVNISSIHAKLTKKNFVAYATSKAALSGMTRAMAVDLGPRVRVNAIEPAAIETSMLRSGFENDENKIHELREKHPSKSIGTPEDIAELSLIIAKTDIGFLHGQIFGIDGAISCVLKDLD